MSTRLRVIAIVVTHNRRELLARCVRALQSQRRALDEIAVVDNGSTDGTAAMLAQLGIRCISQDNVGSAGGWHRGIETAMAEGFDAVWLMDDDGFPDPEALLHLESALEPDVACASSVVLREDDHSRFVFPFPLLDAGGLPVLLRRPRKVGSLSALSILATDGTYPFAHLFNGALVSTAAAAQIGNVERGFFIFGDEVDYFFRLRRAGRVLSVLKARHYHPDVSARPYTPAKVYYYVKNTLLLNRSYLDKVVLRDALAVAAVLARTWRRNGLGTALSYLFGGQSRALYRAIHGGLHGKLGKDFDA